MTTIALAGRRIDAVDAGEPRFPLANRALVLERLTDYLRRNRVARLVCSAACGADLLALSAAEAVGVRDVTVVLPFGVQEFRASSVTDRPGDWGALYDATIERVAQRNELLVLDPRDQEVASYSATTAKILERAAVGPSPMRACIVWEGQPKSSGDQTVSLATGAHERDWPVDTVSTMR